MICLPLQMAPWRKLKQKFVRQSGYAWNKESFSLIHHQQARLRPCSLGSAPAPQAQARKSAERGTVLTSPMTALLLYKCKGRCACLIANNEDVTVNRDFSSFRCFSRRSDCKCAVAVGIGG
jgi:hypothetical protein